MRRADHLTNTERALTLALVLVAAGYAPGTILYRGLAVPQAASTDITPTPAPSRQEAARSGETRITAHEGVHRPNRAAPPTDVEITARTSTVRSRVSCEIDAPRITPQRSIFLSPPSQRGPPALG